MNTERFIARAVSLLQKCSSRPRYKAAKVVNKRNVYKFVFPDDFKFISVRLNTKI